VLVALAAFRVRLRPAGDPHVGAGRVAGQLASSLLLLARAVPLLMLFAFVLFLTTEMWQVFAEIGDASLAGVAALLVAVGTLFLVVRPCRARSARSSARPPPDRR
jgi:hypothetical protein